MSSAEPAQSARGFRWKLAIKLGLTLLVLAFVSVRAASLLRNQDLRALEWRPGWLLLSALTYALGWFPSLWFWRGLMVSMGPPPGWQLCGHAYFAGHLGKYIPGKAGVVLFRAGLMKERGFAFGIAALTSVYETLFVMGMGLVVAGSLLPALVPEAALRAWWGEGDADLPPRWLPAVVLATATLAAIPLVGRLLSALAARFAAVERASARVEVRLLYAAAGAYVAAWALFGLSLGMVLQCLSERPVDLADWPLWTAAASLSTVIGFVSVFAPGGLGVREGILIELLRIQPEISQSQAVSASVLLRFVWLATEVGLYLLWAGLARRAR